MPEQAAHRQAGVPLHFRVVVEQIHQVGHFQPVGFGVFQGIDGLNVEPLLHEAAGRVHPLLLGAEVLADFLAVFQVIGAKQPVPNEKAFLAHPTHVVHRGALPKVDDGDFIRQIGLQGRAQADVLAEMAEQRVLGMGAFRLWHAHRWQVRCKIGPGTRGNESNRY